PFPLMLSYLSHLSYLSSNFLELSRRHPAVASCITRARTSRARGKKVGQVGQVGQHQWEWALVGVLPQNRGGTGRTPANVFSAKIHPIHPAPHLRRRQPATLPADRPTPRTPHAPRKVSVAGSTVLAL